MPLNVFSANAKFYEDQRRIKVHNNDDSIIKWLYLGQMSQQVLLHRRKKNKSDDDAPYVCLQHVVYIIVYSLWVFEVRKVRIFLKAGVHKQQKIIYSNRNLANC
ncbi:hypothetical protein TSAR_011895 [Trichomalopsis sarcophagae]|uniref:Uncharacterized protein n=1 Tax=Trichomalopsis sarcophagae TaxID=543379 RepID=A0A232EH37_9HYME|nr:hypothetical protein TSAR_011895 [Trichomalopsis sarcophagae]